MLVYLILINALGFILMLVDKQKARKNLWRIPEKVLFGAALLGGSLGVLLGMYIVRHKTKHVLFFAGIPVILFIQFVVYAFFFH